MKRLFLVLLLVYLAASAHKVSLSLSLPHFNPADGTGYFWTENALQYRYARMVAHGVPIPDHDWRLQYPEGVEPFRAFTIAMEPAAGSLYRLLRLSIPFHLYAIYFVSFFSSLAVFPVGFLSASFWRSRLAGALAALLYAFAIPAFDRNVGSFLLESFALPFLFAGTWLFAEAMEEEQPRRGALLGVGSGLFMGLGLASWHLSRFYLAQFFLVVFLIVLLQRGWAKGFRYALALFLVPIVVVSWFVPALRANNTLFSPGILLAFGALALFSVKGNVPRPWKVGFGMLLLAIPAVTILLSGAEGGYSHVYDTILAKIRFFGVKPADPSALSMATRVMWVEAFTPPSLELVTNTFLFLVIPVGFAFSGLIPLVRKKELGKGQVLVLALACIYAIEYVMMRRIGSIWIFSLAVVLGGAVLQWSSRERWQKWATGAVLGSVVVGHLYCAFSYLSGNQFQDFVASFAKAKASTDRVAKTPSWHGYDVDMLRWIKVNTRPDDAFLATMGPSGTVIAYADRPVVLHSKFETREIREKYENFIKSLFDTEEALYRFCRQNGADYFLYEPGLALDRDADSYRYLADSLQLSTGSPVVLMQFFPEKLNHFQLVFQNPTYRIYRIVESTGGANLNRPYQPLFDPARYDVSFSSIDRLDLASPAVIRELMNAVNRFQVALAFGQGGRLTEASREAEAVSRQWPDLPHLNAFLCELDMARGDLRSAQSACSREAKITPHDPDTHRLLADLYQQIGWQAKAQQERDLAGELERTIYER